MTGVLKGGAVDPVVEAVTVLIMEEMRIWFH